MLEAEERVNIRTQTGKSKTNMNSFLGKKASLFRVSKLLYVFDTVKQFKIILFYFCFLMNDTKNMFGHDNVFYDEIF